VTGRFKRRLARLRAAGGVEPLGYDFGSERGLPILRHYMAQFLERHAGDVRGHCLEFEDAPYTRLFGGDKVTAVEVIHVDASSPHATIVADLTQPNDVAGEQFDCIICTFVLHLVYAYEALVHELWRLLKPGGVLLVGAPTASMADPDWHEMWRFTPEGLDRVLRRAFGDGDVLVHAYGNSLAAAGQLRGLAAEDFTAQELGHHDPRFSVIVCGRAVRGAAPGAGGPPALDTSWDRYRPR
jgi:SAM-dependent methyltransferase